MSRVGKQPINYNASEIKLEVSPEVNRFGGQTVKIIAKSGEYTVDMRPEVEIDLSTEGVAQLKLNSKYKEKDAKKFMGLYRTLLNNQIIGAITKYSKDLEIVGIGYKAEVQGNQVKLNIGYTTPVVYPLPTGIEAKVADQVFITITGHDKQLVGEVAAQIRRIRKPEPYKGKGIRYKNEVIKRKAGKTAS